MRTKTLFLVAPVAAGVVLGPVPAASAEPQYGTRDRPLESQRYETLRALAHHLDETARGALEGATDDAHHGASAAARRASSIPPPVLDKTREGWASRAPRPAAGRAVMGGTRPRGARPSCGHGAVGLAPPGV